MRRTVLIWPDARLLEVAKEVPTVDDTVRALVDDLLETMYAEDGVGLAATQIGVPWRVVVMDCAARSAEREPLALINGRIVEREGTVLWREGCLSLPGVTAEVERAEKIVVEYLDREGKAQRLAADGLLAVCVQHELDHLDGHLYVDRLGLLERKATLLDYAEARERVQERVLVEA
ncbi:MAG: peptide deformylase [Myxococcales bacterium]|nr:peptide deformylase [Myxococcales bacterium]